MLDSTELREDLLYLQEKYGISSIVTNGLTKSPISAQTHIRHYKTKMLSISLLFSAMGGAFITMALLRHGQWIGLLSGMLGSVLIVHSFSVFKRMKSAIFAIEKIAKYHELL